MYIYIHINICTYIYIYLYVCYPPPPPPCTYPFWPGNPRTWLFQKQNVHTGSNTVRIGTWGGHHMYIYIYVTLQCYLSRWLLLVDLHPLAPILPLYSQVDFSRYRELYSAECNHSFINSVHQPFHTPVLLLTISRIFCCCYLCGDRWDARASRAFSRGGLGPRIFVGLTGASRMVSCRFCLARK